MISKKARQHPNQKGWVQLRVNETVAERILTTTRCIRLHEIIKSSASSPTSSRTKELLWMAPTDYLVILPVGCRNGTNWLISTKAGSLKSVKGQCWAAQDDEIPWLGFIQIKPDEKEAMTPSLRQSPEQDDQQPENIPQSRLGMLVAPSGSVIPRSLRSSSFWSIARLWLKPDEISLDIGGMPSLLNFLLGPWE